MSRKLKCGDCDFVGKSAGGLATHRRAKHPDDRGAMELAVASGDRRQVLVALQQRLAKAVDEAEKAGDVLALAKQLLEVVRELHGEKPKAESEESAVDKIRRDRASRRARATGK